MRKFTSLTPKEKYVYWQWNKLKYIHDTEPEKDRPFNEIVFMYDFSFSEEDLKNVHFISMNQGLMAWGLVEDYQLNERTVFDFITTFTFRIENAFKEEEERIKNTDNDLALNFIVPKDIQTEIDSKSVWSEILRSITEQFKNERINMEGWKVYDYPIPGLVCMINEELQEGLDFEVNLQSGHIEPNVCINSNPIFRSRITELREDGLTKQHDVLG